MAYINDVECETTELISDTIIRCVADIFGDPYPYGHLDVRVDIGGGSTPFPLLISGALYKGVMERK